MITTTHISDDAKAILMLCGRFGDSISPSAKPLDIRQYNALAECLKARHWRPADLLDAENVNTLHEERLPISFEHLRALLARGAAMALAIEKWTNKGLWVLCRSDDEYPQRLKQHLRTAAPPILYGAGELTLLSQGGIAVVGSRNIDEEARQFATDLGRHAAESGMQVVSGGARGVDELAMLGAFNAEGTVVGVLANSLLKASVSGKYRHGIREGRLLLISPYNPESAFHVGNAMGRNKYIYALADYAVVVNSDFDKGGTWNGAVEELRRSHGRTVFVRVGNSVPRGNQGLITLGAKEFPANGLVSNLRDALEEAMIDRPKPSDDASAVTDQPSPTGPCQATKGSAESTATDSTVEDEASAPATRTILDAVKPLILRELAATPRNVEELAKALRVRKAQLSDWLKRLLEEKCIEQRTLNRKKKYVVRGEPNQRELFSD